MIIIVIERFERFYMRDFICTYLVVPIIIY